MQRQIKFRGKRVDNGEWVYGDLIQGGGIDNSEAFILPIDEKNFMESDIVNPATVGQFTGLLDKNGKEIYEGDVVNDDGRERIVKWHTYSCQFYLSTGNRYKEISECAMYGDGEITMLTNIEIITTIHDTPHQ